MKKILSLLLILSMGLTFTFADDLDNLFSDNSIFGASSSIEEENNDLFKSDDLFSQNDLFTLETTDEVQNTSLFEDLLTSETEISGSYYFNFSTGLNYNLDTKVEPTYFASTNVNSNIELSARPSQDTRFYVDGTLTFPFENEVDDLNTVNVNEEYNFFNIDELFYDFIIDDYFIRVGKQTLNMGVGYFYSPANLLNITSINPLDPEGKQEGPIAIKINKPFENNNLYAYLTMPAASNYLLEDISMAATYETLIGDGEYTISGYYNYDIANDPTKVALTVSSPLYTDVDLIAEFVESYDGSEFNFEGTLGLSIMKDITAFSDTSISLIGQYYYNQDGVKQIGLSQFDSTHQIGMMLSLSTPLDLGFSLSSINIISETTGVLTSNLWYDVSDDFKINLGLTYMYGNQNTIQPSIGFTLGQGDF